MPRKKERKRDRSRCLWHSDFNFVPPELTIGVRLLSPALTVRLCVCGSDVVRTTQPRATQLRATLPRTTNCVPGGGAASQPLPRHPRNQGQHHRRDIGRHRVRLSLSTPITHPPHTTPRHTTHHTTPHHTTPHHTTPPHTTPTQTRAHTITRTHKHAHTHHSQTPKRLAPPPLSRS